MKEVDSNRDAWSKLSEEHYHHYRDALLEGRHRMNPYIEREMGDLSGKSVVHLQCNTGADSILLARMGATSVVGVDLVPENVHYAEKLAIDTGTENVRFIASDIMTLSEVHRETYDVVFVSEGAVGWLPDLKKWGQTIRGLLNDGGFLYVFDSHPFFLSLDQEKLANGEMAVKYPYFGKEPDVDDTIGGYATEAKGDVRAYFWMYTISDLINAVASTGLRVEFFNEFPELFFDAGGMKQLGDTGLFNYDFNTDKIPLSFSMKASVCSTGCNATNEAALR